MMTYDELDRRCTRLSQMNYGYCKQADAMRSHIAELETALNEVSEIWNARYEVALKYISELEMALIDIKHLTDPIINRSRTALERKP